MLKLLNVLELLGLYRVTFRLLLACVVLRCGVSVWIVVECVGFAFGVWRNSENNKKCNGYYRIKKDSKKEM